MSNHIDDIKEEAFDDGYDNGVDAALSTVIDIIDVHPRKLLIRQKYTGVYDMIHRLAEDSGDEMLRRIRDSVVARADGFALGGDTVIMEAIDRIVELESKKKHE